MKRKLAIKKTMNSILTLACRIGVLLFGFLCLWTASALFIPVEVPKPWYIIVIIAVSCAIVCYACLCALSWADEKSFEIWTEERHIRYSEIMAAKEEARTDEDKKAGNWN